LQYSKSRDLKPSRPSVAKFGLETPSLTDAFGNGSDLFKSMVL